MGIKSSLKHIRDEYVRKQADSIIFPDFEPSPVIRVKNIYSGRVQKVGFRHELTLLADRLGITGYAVNLENGDVEAVMQGEEEKIRFIQSFMKSLIRIKVKSMSEEILKTVDNEYNFSSDRNK